MIVPNHNPKTIQLEDPFTTYKTLSKQWVYGILSSMAHIHEIFISPSSNYWSHKVGTPGKAPTHTPQEIEAHAGAGLVGDRFYEFKENYQGQVSFMELEALEELKKMGGSEVSNSVFRRNIIISGVDPLILIGKEFKIGTAKFKGCVDCTPCAWMDFAAGDGAFNWLNENNKGGLRAQILESGTMKIGDSLTILT
ncbi:MAG: molybdenum cofactor biosysynthesis protein [Bacteriovoracaceae bacterium]|nr:molybdenum cofactor biosysynthesis protein [Bacteriovoracaceae bacterium]